MNRDSLSETFAEIYNANFTKVYNYIYRMTGDHYLSEDISQETFIQVLKSIEGFRGDCSIHTWIIAIAKNICFRHLSGNKHKSFRAIELLIDTVSSPYRDSPDQLYEKKAYSDQVRNGCLIGLLQCLSFSQRCGFILNVLNDLSIRDVSLIIGKSENSVRILIHRARSNIKEFLCRNCSLYSGENKCRCDNMINFSLNRGLINKFNSPITPAMIQHELREFRNEIDIYRSLQEADSAEAAQKCISAIKNSKLVIFSEKKVK